MRRGWEVEFLDGTIIDESQMNWRKVPKKNIIRLTLRYDGREWNIHNKEAYLQKKRGSVIPGVASSFSVESRSIGWFEDNKKIWMTVDETTGRMRLEVEEF